eukprot:9711769-Karenia_brevis.AAC.1
MIKYRVASPRSASKKLLLCGHAKRKPGATTRVMPQLGIRFGSQQCDDNSACPTGYECSTIFFERKFTLE